MRRLTRDAVYIGYVLLLGLAVLGAALAGRWWQVGLLSLVASGGFSSLRVYLERQGQGPGQPSPRSPRAPTGAPAVDQAPASRDVWRNTARMMGALLLVISLLSGAALLVGTSCTTGQTCNFLSRQGWIIASPALLLVTAGMVLDQDGIRRRPKASDRLYVSAIALSAVMLVAVALYVAQH